jgi:hypothetical protein
MSVAILALSPLGWSRVQDMAYPATHQSVADIGFVELDTDAEGQWLCHSLTGERALLPGTGGWQLGFNTEGCAYTSDGDQSFWAQQLLQTTVHDCNGQWFQVDGQTKTWLDHQFVSKDLLYLDIPICIDRQLLPIKLKRVWAFAIGFNIWWSLSDLQPYIAATSNWRRPARPPPIMLDKVLVLLMGHVFATLWFLLHCCCVCCFMFIQWPRKLTLVHSMLWLCVHNIWVCLGQ